MSIILFSLLGFIFKATAQQCDPSSIGDSEVASDAEFWDGYNGAKFITELDDSTQAQYVKANPKAFIIYYTVYCRYSKDAREGFAGAANSLNQKISFGAVDCNKARHSCRGSRPVDGVPTFYFYKDGAWVEEYRRQRTTSAFVAYLNMK